MDTSELDFITRLKFNYTQLGDVLETKSGLIGELYSNAVINIREKQEIESQTVDYLKNEVLLDIILNKTEKEYQLFLSALRKTNQSHLVEILSGTAVALPAHISVIPEPPGLRKVEIQIMESFILTTASLTDKLLQQPSRSADELQNRMDDFIIELQNLKARLLFAFPERRLLYIYCNSEEIMDSVKQSFEGGPLKNCLESIVLGCIQKDNPQSDISNYSVHIQVKEDDYTNCTNYFKFGSTNISILDELYFNHILNLLAYYSIFMLTFYEEVDLTRKSVAYTILSTFFAFQVIPRRILLSNRLLLPIVGGMLGVVINLGIQFWAYRNYISMCKFLKNFNKENAKELVHRVKEMVGKGDIESLTKFVVITSGQRKFIKLVKAFSAEVK